MNKLKKPLLFTLLVLPAAIIGGLFTCFLLFDTQSEEVINQVISQIGSIEMLTLVTVMQTVMMACVCAFVGYIITDKIGLIKKPFAFNKKGLVIALLFGAILGIVLGADHFASGTLYPEIITYNLSSFTFDGIMASIFYGGIIEEVMLRLFFMSLVSLIIWKVFFRKYTKENIPQKVYIIANILACLLFAAGHLPATIGIFGQLDFFIVLRCFVLNGAAGLLFGELFRRYGIGYAMTAHATAHMVKYLIFAIFI